jgi:hypothetical protein
MIHLLDSRAYYRVYYRKVLFSVFLLLTAKILPIREIIGPGPFLRESHSFINPYGYIALDSNIDSRQVIGSEEVEATLFPAPFRPDRFNQDINAHPELHMTPNETRIGLEFHGPDWNNFRSYGLIEGDFIGARAQLTRGFATGAFSMRHAYGKILWDTGSLLCGQYWHPLSTPECWPQVINYNGGAPFEVYSRAPQLRFTQRWEDYELILAALSQRTFQSPGPFGPSTIYIRRAVIPNLHAQFRIYKNSHLFGIAIDYKRLVPRIVTKKDIKVTEHVDSVIAEAFAKLAYKNFTLRSKLIYAQNGADLLLISGYGVHSINPETDHRTYTPTAAFSSWIDLDYAFPETHWNTGIFAGYTKNLGALEDLFINPTTHRPIVFSLLGVADRIDYAARLSPRLVYFKEPYFIGLELEWTRASWGRVTREGTVTHARPVDNVRLELFLAYIF